MCLRHLGERIDIHGGGNDLIFPHHENEIAQSEGFTGKPFARYWVHNGMMQLDGEAMSKSTGNVYTIEAFLEQHEADVLRLLVFNSHYRSPCTFNDTVIEQAERGLERLRGALRPAVPSPDAPADVEATLSKKTAEAREGFEIAMDDDFNTPGAISHLFELVRAIHQARDAGVSAYGLESAQAALGELAGVLGFRLEADRSKEQEAAPFIDLLIEVRERLRTEKQWKLADMVRDRLTSLGIVLEDGKDGTTWRPK
jgi:cysteinyl-tRNA synthetase